MTRAQKSARAQYSKFHRVPLYLTDAEYNALSSEAYSREISRSEAARRALKHFFHCQATKIDEIVAPPKRWRMPRASLTG